MTRKEQLLVEEHLELVRKIVKGTMSINENVQGLGYEDLYQTGCEALCKAALNYNEARGASFATFALREMMEFTTFPLTTQPSETTELHIVAPAPTKCGGSAVFLA